MPSDDERKLESWSTADMSPEARAHYEKVFVPRMRALEDEIQRTPLTVLVWGPGAGGDAKLYAKRVQIRGHLRKDGIAAFFSEELEEPTIDAPLHTRELIQAAASDLVIVLYGSPGSIAETHDLSNYSTVTPKMLVFVDSRHTASYGYVGKLSELRELYGNVREFSYPKDLDECHLLSAVMTRVQHIRVARWRASI